MQIALLPLDERPVNTRLAADVAAIAGVPVVRPPQPLLPSMKRPGDTAALSDWLESTARTPETDAVVVSLEMLGYGGLIASRTSHDPVADVLSRLRVLDKLRAARPDLSIAAFSLVMRASDSYSSDEEPDYWASYGRELHRLGADLHTRFLTGLSRDDSEDTGTAAPVPDDVRGDFERRRLRNHLVNLAALDLHNRGIVAPLLVTADDTADRSAGSIEQAWILHWLRALPSRGSLLMHPGADEVGAILVARSLNRLHPDPVRYAITCGEDDGLTRVAPYENQPVHAGARGQIAAAGGIPDTPYERPDATLVVHAPDPQRGDWCGRAPAAQHDDAIARTVEVIRQAIDSGTPVGLADMRYANGGDPQLVEALRAEGLLPRLAAYGGWNTAGNTIGSVVAALQATVVGQRAGTFDSASARRLLLHRLVEDWAYQAVVRTELALQQGLSYNLGGLGTLTSSDYLTEVSKGLQSLLDDLSPGAAINDLLLPWSRTFEIDFSVSLPEAAQ